MQSKLSIFPFNPPYKRLNSVVAEHDSHQKALCEVIEMYPHRILVRAKGIQVLQPFDPSGSGKSGT